MERHSLSRESSSDSMLFELAQLPIAVLYSESLTPHRQDHDSEDSPTEEIENTAQEIRDVSNNDSSSSEAESLLHASFITSQPCNGPDAIRFAKTEFLGHWFPEADPNHKRSQTFRQWLSRRKTVLLWACLTCTLVLLVNSISVIILTRKYPDGRLYHGNCDTSAKLVSGLHVAINILSSLLLGASNLGMQLLASPTRKELDNAHENHTWMDIGFLSFRNFKRISRRRSSMLAVLAILSLPLHFLYNSAVVSIKPVNIYLWALVTPDFVTGGSYNITAANESIPFLANSPYEYDETLKSIQNTIVENKSNTFRKLSAMQCREKYILDSNNASQVIIVTSNNTSTNPDTNSVLTAGYSLGPYDSTGWACPNIPNYLCKKPKLWPQTPSLRNWQLKGYDVDYCLSQEIDLEDECSMRMIFPIMYVVVACNFGKCLCVFYTTWLFAWKKTNIPMTTLGDAAVSFLKAEDQHTTSMCLADRTNIGSMWKKKRSGSIVAIPWEPSKRRWWRILSPMSWCFTLACCFVLLITALSFLYEALTGYSTNQGSRTVNFSRLGFGVPTSGQTTAIANRKLSTSENALYSCILFANSRQVAVSVLYVRYNAVITACLVGEEWSHFARDVKKTLRVSAPEGIQRSTYFVSMPWRYGIPMICATASLHWFISQSIFVIIQEPHLANGNVWKDALGYIDGFSIPAIIASASLGFAYIIFLGYFALRSYSTSIPMASSCSAAISAACHPPEEDSEAHLFPVQWGVVSSKEGIDHCALTTAKDVSRPVQGKLYA